jgi:branched-chain amino acid transport system ATP-binding protein
MTDLLVFQEVVAGYLKKVPVLQGISLRVAPGEVVCLIGPNGAGKSTVLRTLSGLLSPMAGQVLFDGEDIGGVRPDLVLRLGVSHVPQGHTAFPDMTVEENLIMGGFTLKDRSELRSRIEEIYEMFPPFADRRKQKAGNLSGGQQKLLEIGRGLMVRPRLMLLDEPSLGLSPKNARLVFDTIGALPASGVTVLMVEQNARSGLQCADRGYVLELGRTRLERPAAELLVDPEVGRLYLGTGLGGRPQNEVSND